jgi:hypothetical protein
MENPVTYGVHVQNTRVFVILKRCSIFFSSAEQTNYTHTHTHTHTPTNQSLKHGTTIHYNYNYCVPSRRCLPHTTELARGKHALWCSVNKASNKTKTFMAVLITATVFL